MNALERLVALEDIRDLAARYSHCRDALDLEGLLELFSDEAILELGPKHGGDLVGKAAIRAHYERSFVTGGGRPFSTMHFVTNPWIVLTGTDTAQARWSLLVGVIDGSTGTPLRYLGVYDDEYRRERDKWRVRERRVEFTWPDRIAVRSQPGMRRSWAPSLTPGAVDGAGQTTT